MGKLGIYLLANYPSRERFLQAVRVCESCHVDFLEVGFAFSDPIADGGLLETASYKVLKRCTLADMVEAFQEARSIFTRKTYIMTYSNLVFRQGIPRFLTMVGATSGLILADLPLRETSPFEKELKGFGMRLIRFVTPESRAEDIADSLKGKADFIYFVSKRGTTGGAFYLEPETREKLTRVKGKGIDVFLGFGIRSKADVDKAFRYADGAIIGTKAVGELEHGIDRFEAFIRSITQRIPDVESRNLFTSG